MKKRGVFFYILILLALIAVGVLIFLLAPGRQVSTPPVTLPTPQVPDSSAPTTQESVTGGQVIAITPKTVQTGITTLHRSDSYSRTLTVQDFWSGGSRVRLFQTWVRGDSLRLAVTGEDDGAQAQENLLIRDGEKWIWYPDGPMLGYASECWIDPDTGLLLGERRYDGDILIYSRDSSVPDLTTPDESVFTPPRA